MLAFFTFIAVVVFCLWCLSLTIRVNAQSETIEQEKYCRQVMQGKHNRVLTEWTVLKGHDEITPAKMRDLIRDFGEHQKRQHDPYRVQKEMEQAGFRFQTNQ